jgi:hypothetical protein
MQDGDVGGVAFALPKGITNFLFGVGVVVLFAIGVWLQSEVHLNHDVGWILRSSGWLLDGKRFGSDILDPNPPLIWFLTVPAAAIARAGWMSEPAALRTYMWLLTGVALLLCHLALRPMRGAGERSEACVLTLAIAGSVAVLPGAAFGQREFLSFVFAMPYVLLVAGRLAYDTDYSRPLAVTVGFLAGIGFAFKPWLLAVPLGVELAYLCYRRSLGALLRPESLAICIAICAYLISVVLLAPDYLFEAIPLIRAVYWAYENADFGQMIDGGRGVPTIVATAFGMMWLARRWSPYASMIAMSAGGFAFSYWVQRKGFAYHAYPMLAASFVLLGYAWIHATRRLLSGQVKLSPRWRVAVIGVVGVIVCKLVVDQGAGVTRWFENYRIGRGIQGIARQALIDRVNGLAGDNEYVYAFSTHPYPAFPTLNYLDAEWASALPCQFVVPAYFKRSSIGDPQRLGDIDAAVSYVRETVLSEFLRHRPRVVLVNASFRRLGLGYSKFDDIAFYSEDVRFAQLWARYRAVDGVADLPHIKIFVRAND